MLEQAADGACCGQPAAAPLDEDRAVQLAKVFKALDAMPRFAASAW